MANMGIHPAPGLGDLLPGWFDVPQNPIKDARPVTVTPRIGDIVAGTNVSFVVPQNPLKSYASGNVRPLGTGMGCACDGGQINGVGMGDIMIGSDDVTTDWNNFMTQVSAGNLTGALSTTVLGIPVWAYAAALVAIPMLTSKSGGRKR